MKKWRAVFLICVSLTPLFAQGNVDNYSNVALSYDVNYEIAKIDGTTIDTTLNSMGAAWNIFTFKPEKQVGVFSYLGMYKPLGGVIRTGGVGVPYSLFDTGFSFGEAFMIGPGFRKKSGANIEILAGVGPALYFFGLGSGATNGLVLQVGLGGDVNINFCLSERMYLNLGLRAQASFYSYTFVFDPTVASFKPTNYRSYAINPRLGIGFRH